MRITEEMKKKIEEKRPIDVYFDKYAESHQNKTNKFIHWICVPLIFFSVIGLITAIPFPKFEFLGRYQTYVNWFSFVMAATIFYYYSLSRTLAFLMIIVISIMYFFIVQLEYVEQNGGLALWQSSLIIFVVAWIGQFIGHKIEGKKPSFLDDLKFLLIGPIWLLHFICKKAGLPY